MQFKYNNLHVTGVSYLTWIILLLDAYKCASICKQILCSNDIWLDSAFSSCIIKVDENWLFFWEFGKNLFHGVVLCHEEWSCLWSGRCHKWVWSVVGGESKCLGGHGHSSEEKEDRSHHDWLLLICKMFDYGWSSGGAVATTDDKEDCEKDIVWFLFFFFSSVCWWSADVWWMIWFWWMLLFFVVVVGCTQHHKNIRCMIDWKEMMGNLHNKQQTSAQCQQLLVRLGVNR